MVRVYLKSWDQRESWQEVLEEILGKKNLKIHRTTHGKPYLTEEKVFFNVSHSGNYLVIALGETELGVDIQKPKEILLPVIEKVIQPQERELYEKMGPLAFQIFWTLKESYVKALGRGLTMPFSEYYFQKEDQWKVYEKDQRLDWNFYVNDQWIFNYAVTVCTRETEVHWIRL